MCVPTVFRQPPTADGAPAEAAARWQTYEYIYIYI